MAEKFNLYFNPNFVKTSGQQQCEYDSYAIAHKILTFVIDLKQNPQMEFPAGTPNHAQKILRAHIATRESRYNQEEIWLQIQDLHKPCKEYIDAHSHMTQTTEILQHSHAKLLASDHKEQLQALLSTFKNSHPRSILFSSDHKWHTITFEEDDSFIESAPIISARNRYTLYAVTGIAAAATITMFIYNLFYSTNERDKPLFNA